MTTIMEGVPGFQFGCDPEGFIKDKDGVAVTAEGLIPGTKSKPHAVKYGAVQVDGMAAEFNIDPVNSFAEFDRNVSAVVSQLEGFLPKGYTFNAIPAVKFSKEAFDAAPDKAKELGCSPDFDAWTGQVNPPPKDVKNPYLRTASGHLHVGWTEAADLGDPQHIMNCQDLVKQFDWYLGAYSVSLDHDPTRRRLYGRAGAYRPKEYGVEYRVLSNFWITSKERRLAVWNRMQIAIQDMRKRFFPDKVPAGTNELIVDYINSAKRNNSLEAAYSFPILSMDSGFARY